MFQPMVLNCYHRLSDLSEKGEIPAKLVAVARSLRQLRNVGAHGNIPEEQERPPR